MGEVLHLFKCLVHRFPMEEVDEAEVVANKGFKGCIHGRPASKRQVSLIDKETLDKLGIAPGMVKENITTLGMDLQVLSTGQILRIGQGCVEEVQRLGILLLDGGPPARKVLGDELHEEVLELRGLFEQFQSDT